MAETENSRVTQDSLGASRGYLPKCANCLDGESNDGAKVIRGAIPKPINHPKWPYVKYKACLACGGYWEGR